MTTGADGVRRAYPLFQAEGGGSRPTSALHLFFREIDHATAKALNRLWHSRFPDVGGGNARLCHAAEFDGIFYAAAIWTNPTSPKLPQREWLMLKRWAVAPDAPRNTARRMHAWMLRELRARFPEVTTLLSYSDPDSHTGTVYRVCGWAEGETTERKSNQTWHNRRRSNRTENLPPCRVTRWTKQLHKGA